MNLATIQRDQLGPAGSTTPTLGQWRLDFDPTFLCQTLELPDNGNAHMISCVPSGVFPLVYEWSEKHGRDIWHIIVPGRDNIEVHIGCSIKDTDGCVVVGMKRGDVQCTDGVTRSGIYQSHAAFDALYAALAPYQGQSGNTITIVNPS